MINEKCAKRFCKDDISLIENYDKAIADKTQTWHCHHRRETIYSKSDLIEIREYYKRPAIELIFLSPKEHYCLHHKGKPKSEETRRKISDTQKGKKRKPLSEEHKRKIGEACKGERNGFFGKTHSEEAKRKNAESHKGKTHSKETKQKMSEAIKLWWQKRKSI